MVGLSSTINSAAAYRQPPHQHDRYMLMVPQSGLMRITDEDAGWSSTLLARQFLLVPPGRYHSTAALSAEQSHLAVYADPDIMRAAFGSLAGNPHRTAGLGIWATTPALEHLVLARMHMHGRNLAQIDHLILMECAATALAAPRVQRSTTQRHGHALVREIQAWLVGRLDRAPDIDAIAATFHVSRRHLTRLFADHAGQTVLEFIQAMRMAHARDLLAHTSLAVVDIAQSVGFQSPSHFAAVFRRHHGQPPDQWRRHSA